MKGLGNSLDFGARMYDSRLGRWLSLDPLQAKYPGLTPYGFVANSPLMFIDPDGRVIKNAEPPGSKNYIRMERAIGIIQKTNEKLYNELHNSPTVVNLRFGQVDNAPKPAYTMDRPGENNMIRQAAPPVKHVEGLTQPVYKIDPSITGADIQRDRDGNVAGGQVMRSRNAEEQDAYRDANPNDVMNAGKPYALTDEEAAAYIQTDFVDITLDDKRNSSDMKTAKTLAHELGHARTSVFSAVKDWIFGTSGEGKGRHGKHDPSGQSADAAEAEFKQNKGNAK